MKGHNMKIIERFVKPIVLSILDTKKFVNEELVDKKISSLTERIVDIEAKVNKEIIPNINNLINVVDDNKHAIDDAIEIVDALSTRFVQQSAKLEEILVRIDVMHDCHDELLKSIDSFDDVLKNEIKKTRSDAAVLIKQTRDNVSDLQDKLDAFIDTISETISELKK